MAIKENLKKYKTLFKEGVINSDLLRIINYLGADSQESPNPNDIKNPDMYAIGKGDSVEKAISNAVAQMPAFRSYGKDQEKEMVAKILADAKANGVDLKKLEANAKKQQFLPGMPREFSKPLHFIEIEFRMLLWV